MFTQSNRKAKQKKYSQIWETLKLIIMIRNENSGEGIDKNNTINKYYFVKINLK